MPRYARSGHLIYAQTGTLMAAPFDVQHLNVTGTAVPVVQGILQNPATGAAQYAVSQSGSLAYISGSQTGQSGIVWVSRNGAERAIRAPLRYYQDPRLSPDGQKIAISTADEGHYQVWLFDVSRETMSPFTFQGNNRVPVWTRDGKHIAFLSDRFAPETSIVWERADGSGGSERLTTSKYIILPFSFSPDGELLAFIEINSLTQDDIWMLRLRDGKAQPFLQTPANETAPAFSPDGHWLAYVSEESGQREVYVQPYPGPGGKWQISTDGGTEPVWNRNGRELFYRNGDKMMAVDIDTHPAFAAGKPRQLFEGDYVLNYFPAPYYDVSSDGQRFLMLKPSEQEQSALTHINVVLNWFEELKQKVPAEQK
jgi:serine/threonine-protein kinase